MTDPFDETAGDEVSELRSYYTDYLRTLEDVTRRGSSKIHEIQHALNSQDESRLSDMEREILQVSSRTMSRRFLGDTAAKMVGVSKTSIYKAEDAGRLPEPEFVNTKGAVRRRRAGYTLEQINHMRDVFGTRPSRGKSEAAIINCMNLKGGSWKTTTTLLLGQYLALKGYRVLLVDTDPQGTLSFFMGWRPDYDTGYEDTIAPFVLGDLETMAEGGGTGRDLRYAVKKTHWPNIDIVPANLQLASIDLQLPITLSRQKTLEDQQAMFLRVRAAIDSVKNDYDIVLVDGTPSLNLLTMNVFSAGDVCLIPVPAQMADYASTLQFILTMMETIATYRDNNLYIPLPDIRVVITKFSRGGYVDWMSDVIHWTFGKMVVQGAIHKTDEIGKRGIKIKTIYEEDPRDVSSRKTFKNTLDMFDVVFDEILETIIKPLWEEPDDEPSELQQILRTEGVI